jgi:hypothetical protein
MLISSNGFLQRDKVSYLLKYAILPECQGGRRLRLDNLILVYSSSVLGVAAGEGDGRRQTKQ